MKQKRIFESGWRIRNGQLIQAGLPGSFYFTDLIYTDDLSYVAAVGDRLRYIADAYDPVKDANRPLSHV